jgi:hypothetical protein
MSWEGRISYHYDNSGRESAPDFPVLIPFSGSTGTNVRAHGKKRNNQLFPENNRLNQDKMCSLVALRQPRKGPWHWFFEK